jgi:peptide deformylase
MFDAMLQNGGIGLAAPQVGVPLRLIVGGRPEVAWKFALVNPVILKESGETAGAQPQ